MLVNQDNLTYIKTLNKDSIDFIYFDPPFGITEAHYDIKLKWNELWKEMWRVLKPKGVIAIHSSQPFTFDLVSTQRKHFKYCWYWEKNNKTGHLFSKHQPMRCIEEICIFYKKNKYNPQMKKNDKPQRPILILILLTCLNIIVLSIHIALDLLNFVNIL
jgi:site-specific DNA-methyltransferase (adenine-specific)